VRKIWVLDRQPVLANPAVREIFLGTEVTAALSGGSLARTSAPEVLRQDQMAAVLAAAAGAAMAGAAGECQSEWRHDFARLI